MTYRSLLQILIVAGAIVAGSLVPVSVSGQATTSATRPNTAAPTTPWTLPRTHDGQPDLQGIWSFASATPLERPPEFVGQEFLSDEHVALVERRATERLRVELPGGPFFNTPAWWLESGTRVVNTRRSSLIVSPSDGRLPAMTPGGVKRAAESSAAARAANGFDSLTPWERCITRGLPAMMLPNLYNNHLQILQTPGYVAIITEMIHEARIVGLQDRAPLPNTPRAWMGYSRGHWDGDTLVIATTHFSDQAKFFGMGNRFLGGGGQLRLIERLRRIDARTIDYQLTIDDPANWTRPWTMAFPLVNTDSRIYEYACHEGNYGVPNILSAARAAEKVPENGATGQK